MSNEQEYKNTNNMELLFAASGLFGLIDVKN
jgi:hypothetical protein